MLLTRSYTYRISNAVPPDGAAHKCRYVRGVGVAPQDQMLYTGIGCGMPFNVSGSGRREASMSAAATVR